MHAQFCSIKKANNSIYSELSNVNIRVVVWPIFYCNLSDFDCCDSYLSTLWINGASTQNMQ